MHGRLLWATKAGGTNEDVGFGIASDRRGNSHVTGHFQGTVTFGAGEDNETELTAAGDFDIFVAKYDRNGLLLWATKAGGPGSDCRGQGIATDRHGNSYVSGFLFGPATFGAGEVNETELRPARASDAFIAKYDRNGLLLWATKAGTTDGLGDGIATDNRGDSYVTGFFFGRSTFGAGEDNETVLTATGSRPDIFVAKYDRNGRLLWATKAGGTDDDVGQGIATDRHGNSYVSGSFLGTAIFGAGEDNETELSGSGEVGQFALFVAKYDRNGLLLWAKGGGSDSVLSGGGHGHRDGPPRQQLRDRRVLWHSNVWDGRSQRDRA